MSGQQIPKAFTSVIGLGALSGYFPVRVWNRWGNLVLFAILLTGAMLAVLYDVNNGHTQLGDDLFPFILFAFGLLAGWNAYSNWNKGVVTYERGFAYNDRKGLQIWCWEDLVSTRIAIKHYYTGYNNSDFIRSTHRYTLYNRLNQRLVLSNSLDKIEELADYIDQNTFPRLYSHSIEQYNAGETIIFGPVAVSKAGITIGNKTYPWTEMKQVTVDKGILMISRKEGGWFSGASASAAAIPNLRVMVNIIAQVGGRKADNSP